jgi:hypothetical protein
MGPRMFRVWITLTKILFVSVALAGCGFYVPEIQEFPADSVDGELLVQSIVANINCEIANAVNYVIAEDIRLAPANGGHRTAAWFDDWGIQTTLLLTLDEKGSVNPVVNWLPPSPANSIFNLGGTVTFQADANRIDKLNSFNTVQQFKKKGCSQRSNGVFLLSSDLKLREWLVDVILAKNTGGISIPTDANGPFKSNVISHEVKFEVTTSGGLTPGLKLTRVAINQSGNFLTASRDRTHDLTITLGPVTSTVVGQKSVTAKDGTTKIIPIIAIVPSGQASDAHLASQIGSAVGAAVKSALAN